MVETRPGVPLADMVFAFVFAVMQHMLLMLLKGRSLVPEVEIEGDTVFKMPRIAKATEIMAVARRFGMQANLLPSKTEVIATFKGPGAAEARRAIFQKEGAGGGKSEEAAIPLTDGVLRFVANYKNLGFIASCRTVLGEEVAAHARAARTTTTALVLCAQYDRTFASHRAWRLHAFHKQCERVPDRWLVTTTGAASMCSATCGGERVPA